MRFRGTVRALVAMAVMLTTMWTATVPASAAGERDYLSFNHANVKFGLLPHPSSFLPVGDGFLSWTWTAQDEWQPILSGYLVNTGLAAGECARLKMRHFDSNGGEVETAVYTQSSCGPGIDEEYVHLLGRASEDIDYVVVTAQVNATGTWVDVASRTRWL